jgi:hypothetical protein
MHDVQGTVGTLRCAHPTAFQRQIGTTGKSEEAVKLQNQKYFSLPEF